MVAGLFTSIVFSTFFVTIVPQAILEYVHEFEDDQRDRDYFNVGAGVVFVLPRGCSAHTVTAGLRFAF